MISQGGSASSLLRIKKNSLFALAAPLYILFSFFRFYVENQAVYTAITISSIACGILFLAVSVLRKPTNPVIISLVCAFSILGLFNLLFDHNQIGQVLPQFLSHLGYAWILLHSRLNAKLLHMILSAIIIFFVLKILTGTNPEDVFTISRNYISVIIILSISFYVFACHQDGKMPSLLLLVMSMVILLWAIGRAGILSGAIILLGVFLLSKKHLLAATLLSLAVGASVSLFQPNIIDDISQITVGLERFEKLSTKSQREVINSEYIESVSTYPSNLFFGSPLKSIQAIQEVDGNPHNAYINLHITFGLLGILVFWAALSVATINLYRNREYLLILMLVVGSFRSIFDSTAFHGPMDVVIFYCIFKGLKNYYQYFNREGYA